MSLIVSFSLNELNLHYGKRIKIYFQKYHFVTGLQQMVTDKILSIESRIFFTLQIRLVSCEIRSCWMNLLHELMERGKKL